MMADDGAQAHCSWQQSPCASSGGPVGDEAEGESCPICLEAWTSEGEHRLVALKCGHLFGAACVKRWLSGRASCPLCKSMAELRDLRGIYARRLVAADTGQLRALREQLARLGTEKSRLEAELALHRQRSSARTNPFSLARRQGNERVDQPPPTRKWKFALERNLDVGRNADCRVLAFNSNANELYVAQRNACGHGVRTVTCAEYRLQQFIPLHSKPIRDLAYSPRRDVLLSVGLDGVAKFVERGLPVATVRSGMPLWSCTWDHLRTNEFFVGGVGGVVHQYDVRNPKSYVQRLADPIDLSPVASLCSTEFGLLSCQLNSCWLWREAMWQQWQPKALPIEGTFMCLRYDTESRRVLVSGRPRGNGVDKSTLHVSRLQNRDSPQEVLFEVDQSFAGSAKSTLLTRCCWVHALDAHWVAAHSESDAVLYLHGLDGAQTICLPAADPALDVSSWLINGNTVVAALSASRLRLYHAITTD